MSSIQSPSILHRKKGIIISFGFYILISLFIFRGILQPGFVANGDQILIEFPDIALQRYAYMLDPNEQAGKLNFELARYPLIALFSLVGKILSSEFSNRLFIIASSTLGFYTMFFLARRLTNNTPAAFLAGVFYGVNPWITSRILAGHMGLLLGIGLIPLFLTIFFQSVGFPKDFIYNPKSTRRIKPIFLSSIILATISATVMLDALFLTLIIGLVLILFWAVYITFSKSITWKKRIISNLTLTTIIILAVAFSLCSYWLIPFAAYTLTTSVQLGSSEFFPWLHEHAILENVLRLKGYWWSPSSETLYTTNSNIFNGITLIFSYIPFLLLLVTLISLNNSKERLIAYSFTALFLIGVVLSMGENLLGGLYNYFTLFGIFRDPDKYSVLIALPYAFFVGAFAEKAIRALNSRRYSLGVIRRKINSHQFHNNFFVSILLIFLMTSHLTANWPVLTGNFRNSYDSLDIPEEYSTVNNWLQSQQDDFRVLWLPSSDYLKFEWSKNRGINEPARYLSAKPIIQMVDPTRDAAPWTSISIMQINHLLEQNETLYIGKLLGTMNIKYIIYRSDIVSPNFPNMLSSLLAQHDLELMFKEGPLYIFKNINYLPKIRAADQTIAVADGVKGLSKLSFWIKDFTKTSFIYPETQRMLDPNDVERILNADSFFYSTYNFVDLFLATIPPQYYHDAYSYATPSTSQDNYGWVQSIFETVSRGRYFYGEGTARTYSDGALLRIPLPIKQPGIHDIWIRLFGGEQLYEVTLDGVQINTISYPSNLEFKWVKYQSVNLEAKEHIIQILAKKQSFLHIVDEVIIVPHKYQSDAYAKFMKMLTDKNTIIYGEAEESVLHGIGTYTINSAFSQKRGIHLDGLADLTNNVNLIIPSKDEYKIGIRGISPFNNVSFTLYRVNSTEKISTTLTIGDTLGWYYSPTIEPNAGDYRIIINGSGIDVDALILFKTSAETFRNSQSVTQITSQIPNPTKASISTNQDNPSTIIYSSSINQYWQATINNIPKKPFLCDSFSICIKAPYSGNNLIHIEYTLQIFGYFGYALSLITLLIIISLYFISLQPHSKKEN